MSISASQVTRFGVAGQIWRPAGSFSGKAAASVIIPSEPPVDDRVGGAHAGYSGRGQRKKDRAAQDEQELLEIIAIAMPEILRYLK